MQQAFHCNKQSNQRLETTQRLERTSTPRASAAGSASAGAPAALPLCALVRGGQGLRPCAPIAARGYPRMKAFKVATVYGNLVMPTLICHTDPRPPWIAATHGGLAATPPPSQMTGGPVAGLRRASPQTARVRRRRARRWQSNDRRPRPGWRGYSSVCAGEPANGKQLVGFLVPVCRQTGVAGVGNLVETRSHAPLCAGTPRTPVRKASSTVCRAGCQVGWPRLSQSRPSEPAGLVRTGPGRPEEAFRLEERNRGATADSLLWGRGATSAAGTGLKIGRAPKLHESPWGLH